jgi:hypothetical protein
MLNGAIYRTFGIFDLALQLAEAHEHPLHISTPLTELATFRYRSGDLRFHELREQVEREDRAKGQCPDAGGDNRFVHLPGRHPGHRTLGRAAAGALR